MVRRIIMIYFNKVSILYIVILFMLISHFSPPTEGRSDLSPPTKQLGHLYISNFVDINSNGKRDTNESALAGTRFIINGPERELTQITGTNGIIDLDLPSGDYEVSEILAEGWVNTTPETVHVRMEPGEERTIFFGNFRPLSHLLISNFVDINSNGKREANEPALAGTRFFVEGPEGVVTKITGTDGIIDLDLPSGDYEVSEILAEGWVQTSHTHETVHVRMIPGKEMTVIFGNFRPLSHLSILKFLDVNLDGKREANEPALAGTRFLINGPERELTQITGTDGTIDLDLPSGDYEVSEILAEGWVQTSPGTVHIRMEPGEERRVHFGNYRAIIINNDEIIFKLKSNRPVIYNNVTIKGDIDADKLNLTSTLSDIKITNSKIKDNVNFSNINFSGQIDFEYTTFEGFADFSNTTFRNKANFENVTFLNYVSFTGSTGNLFLSNIKYDDKYNLYNGEEGTPKSSEEGLDLGIWAGIIISFLSAIITFIVGLEIFRRRGKQNG